MRRVILARAGEWPWAPVYALIAVAAPTLVRMLLEPWLDGVPFLTYFPVLIVASVVLGRRWAVAVLAVSGLVANYVFQPPVMVFTLVPKELVASACFLVFGGLIIVVGDALRGAVTELERASMKEAELNLELQHRVNNNLAVIQALAQQTARRTGASEAFYTAFRDRLLAVSAANKLLSRRDWELPMLPDLAEAALNPFTANGRISIKGPRCHIPTRACVPLALVLHELATNATKYGALSVPSGHVEFGWEVEGGRCHMWWREAGGPTVVPATRQGLGSRLLKPHPGLDVSIEFDPRGVRCVLLVDGASTAQEAAGAPAQPALATR